MVKISDLAMPKKKHYFKFSFGIDKIWPLLDFRKQKYKIAHLICYPLTSNFRRCKPPAVKPVELKHSVDDFCLQTGVCRGRPETSLSWGIIAGGSSGEFCISHPQLSVRRKTVSYSGKTIVLTAQSEGKDQRNPPVYISYSSDLTHNDSLLYARHLSMSSAGTQVLLPAIQ